MRIWVKAVPGSGKNEVEKVSQGEYKVWLKAPAEKGKANDLLESVLAEHFGTGRSAVKIIAGRTSRKKLVEVGGR